jgi:nicotinamidase/pyrazinamidase
MDALLIIDIQNDFCPGGKLAVENGDEIIEPVNALSRIFRNVIQTQDWHPINHSSFASNHSGKEPYETVEMEYGEQVLWPDHCMQGSIGADFHPDLHTDPTKMIIRKGYRKEIDSYSAFFENDHSTKTGLDGYLREFDIKRLFLCGLATDFCVKWSALDARKLGYETFLITDAVKGIDIDGSVAQAMHEMKEAGVKFLESEALIKQFHNE